MRAAEQLERDRDRLHAQWRLKIERATFEAGRARRQYDAVDPENRLVCRELERQWEAKLTEQRQVEEAYQRFQHEQPRRLSGQDRERVRALANDLPALWQAASTTAGDRRALVRQLIDRVVITRRGSGEVIDVAIQWRGMPETIHVVYQGTRRYDQLDDFARLSARVAELKGRGLTAAESATVLNDEGFRTPRGGAYTRHRLYRLFGYLRQSNALPGARPEDGPQQNEWWVQDLARKLGVEISRLRQWRLLGFIQWRKLPGQNGRIIVWADRSELSRLRQLSSFCQNQPGQPIPKALATPKRSNTARKTRTRSEDQ